MCVLILPLHYNCGLPNRCHLITDADRKVILFVYVGTLRQGLEADGRGVLGQVGLLWQGVVAR